MQMVAEASLNLDSTCIIDAGNLLAFPKLPDLNICADLHVGSIDWLLMILHKVFSGISQQVCQHNNRNHTEQNKSQ